MFELVNNGGGSLHADHAVSFNGTNGAFPSAGLIADAAGDLFGTTAIGRGRRLWHGVRAREQRRRQLHADHAAQLRRHQWGNPGCRPDRRRRRGPLRHDSLGGATGAGTVFELVNNGGGSYTPTTLLSFNGANGAAPMPADRRRRRGPLRHDRSSAGRGYGTVFELVNNGGGATRRSRC